MKKVIAFFTLSLCLATLLNAQIPNPGFENWYNSSNGFDPVGWITSNATPFVSVQRTTPGHQGNYAVRLNTWEAGIMTVPGVCQSDAFNFSSRPSALNGFVKCTVMPGDTVSITVTVTKGGLNGTAVGAARQFYTSNLSSYTAFNLPIYYGSPDATDTIYIDLIAGSQMAPALGTELIVDDLSFTPATDVADIKVPPADICGQNYPNPCSEFTTIPLTLASAGPVNIMVSDLFGREIRTICHETMLPGEHKFRFSVAGMPEGIYYYVVQGDHFTDTRKFTVSR